MVKPQKAVIDNTVYIAMTTLIMSVFMQAVFLVVAKWDVRVLYGNLLGGAAAVGNFFAMAMTVQLALDKDEKQAKATMHLSHALRYAFLIIVAAFGCVFKGVFNPISVVLPLLFPRVGVMLYPIIVKRRNDKQ